MAKRTPEETWHTLVLESYAAFRTCPEFVELRKKGLKGLKRRKLLTEEEWWELGRSGEFLESEECEEFRQGCEELGDRYGLATGTVEFACLLKGYDPEKYPYPIANEGPRVQVVTEVADQLFFHWLAWETKALYLSWVRSGVAKIPEPSVVHQNGSTRTGVIFIPVLVQPNDSLKDLPPISQAFCVSFEIPLQYPPTGAAEIARAAAQFERELARRLGYKVTNRIRKSLHSDEVKKLRTEEKDLPSGSIYDIADDLLGEQDLGNDQTTRNLVKQKRHRAIKRHDNKYG